MKRMSLAALAVFVFWTVTDMIIHGYLLMPTYQETAHLWRSEAEMKNGLLTLVTVIGAIGFVLIFNLIKDKDIKTGALFGVILGITWGVSMGFGTYSYTPIPYMLALSWFAATVVQVTVAGVIAGSIMKSS